MRLFSLLLLRGDRHLLPRCSSLPRLLVTPLVFNRRAPSFVHVHLPSTDRTDAALMIGRPMRFNVADHFNAAGRADRHGPLKTARPRVKLNPPKRRLAYTCETCSCKSTLSHGHAPPWRRGPCDTERASRRRPARQLWRVAVGCPRLVCPPWLSPPSQVSLLGLCMLLATLQTHLEAHHPLAVLRTVAATNEATGHPSALWSPHDCLTVSESETARMHGLSRSPDASLDDYHSTRASSYSRTVD
jgi:hypothetical protein